MRIQRIYLLLYSLFFIQISCNDDKRYTNFSKEIKQIEVKNSSNLFWQHLDIEKDTTPGVSLGRAIETLPKRKITPVIIAILDQEIDIYSDKLSEIIWRNSKEIEGDNIDNDNNGYVDDIQGWNFRGNNQGISSSASVNEYVRVVRDYENKNLTVEITLEEYERAKKKLDSKLKKAKEDKEYADMLERIVSEKEKIIVPLLKKNKYTVGDLNSLINSSSDSIVKKYSKILIGFLENNWNYESILKYQKETTQYLVETLNVDFNDRSLQKDDPYNINDIYYGNNNVSSNLDEATHGTIVSGILARFYEYFKENNEMSPIKIMPVVISGSGENPDKDIAVAIKYAVDNGASIISLSFGKEFSTHDSWVKDAILYAQINEVLIVSSAGNSYNNIDNPSIYNYPNDTEGNIEFSNNFIKVGSSSRHLDKRLKSRFSNYGKEQVDIFAPGDSIQTLLPFNKTKWERGTSLSSPLVSGIAALIRAYYPSLTASEVKQILMDSGVEYDILVDVPTKENPEQQLPFNQLSKSGKIVNAYNAMLMAEQFVKEKKKK
ncbi:S8 family serine peptidase [Dokdonia sp.]|uniref:S8 family serine peptidase n=1 Tax=Dokdonia sp. TaxID=2024995 RepID=UPI0032662D32